MALNETDIESLLKVSTDQDTLGFDLRAGQTWIYPTNYPVRDYQYNIAQNALYQNTLVSLPTGLGKTFIAAVVMYNFYRWYPNGKIIFMAPTKPLVRQQIDACYNIMAIPPEVTVELTGAKVTASRVNIWKDKRVFFITPHILQNDLESIPDLGQKIRCIVIDEAHKALGRQANCEVLRKLKEVNSNFRVLALSATPGNNFKNITEVISNLFISHIECRTDESPDVTPYVFNRTLETVIVPLTGKLSGIKEKFIKILDVYTRPLIKFNVLSGNCAMMTKGKILMTMRDYKENCKNRNNYNHILCNFNICITLYHGYELLVRHGLRNFLVFFEGCLEKPLINSINGIHELLDEVRQYLGPHPNVESLPDGSVPEIPRDTLFGHPKFYKLGEIVSKHFQESSDENSTRVMVFCEYRESVMEAYTLLLTYRPHVRPRIFIGKGTGVTQVQQLQVIKLFREGKCNTLVATCIGEEGIDVGEVDLIVCFDISTRSPVRMVQRMGRTGRKRNGRVVILVTEGKEQQTLQECLIQKSNMNNLLCSTHLKNHLYTENPRMIPDGLEPQCIKMHITVTEKDVKEKKKKNTVKSMFDNITASQLSSASSGDNEKGFVVPEFNRIPRGFELWSLDKDEVFNSEQKVSSVYSKRLEKQRHLSITGNFGHSSTTEAYISLLKFADKKKYNLPTSRGTFSQKSKAEPWTLSQLNNFRQVDIRNMFKPKNTFPQDLEITSDETELSCIELIQRINNYVGFGMDSEFCEICIQLFDCSLICLQEERKNPQVCKSLPDISIVDNITSESLDIFLKEVNPKHSFNDTERFDSNMSAFLKELNAQNVSLVDNKANRLSETLEFLRLTRIDDIFDDEEIELDCLKNVLCKSDFITETANRNQPEDTAITNKDLDHLNLLTTPPKTCRLSINSNVSPILASGKIRDLKSKINSRLLSQGSSTPNSGTPVQNNKNTENLQLSFRKSFKFDDFESFVEKESSKTDMKSEITSSKVGLEEKIDVFEDDIDLKNFEILTNEKGEKIVNIEHDSQETVIYFEEFENNSQKQENKDLNCAKNNPDSQKNSGISIKSEHNPTINLEMSKISENFNNSSKIPDAFEHSRGELANIQSMFDIAEESLFESSGTSSKTTANKTNDSENNMAQNQTDNNWEIADDTLFQSSEESESEVNNKISVKKKLENNNENKKVCANKTLKEKLIQTESATHKLNNTKCDNEKPDVSKYFVPETTTLISSDEEFDFIKSPKLNKKINLSKLHKTISKTNTTLLSITELVNFIEDDLDSSLKENQCQNKVNAQNSILCETLFNKIENKNTENKSDINKTGKPTDLQHLVEVSENKHVLSEKSFNRSENNAIEKTNINKINTSTELENFDDFWNDDSDFDLISTLKVSKNTPIKNGQLENKKPTLSLKTSKLSLNFSEKNSGVKLVETNKCVENNIKNKDTNNKDTESVDDFWFNNINDFEFDNLMDMNTQKLQEPKENIVLKNDNIDNINSDSDYEESLLQFSCPTQRLRSQSSQKNLVPENKLQLKSITESQLNKGIHDTILIEHSPIKAKKNSKRPIELSDSDDDFEDKPFYSQKQNSSEKLEMIKQKLSQFSSAPSGSKTVERTWDKKLSEDISPLKQRNKKKRCEFIDDEADVESNDDYISDSAEEGDLDRFEHSFIHDSQMNHSENIDIHAKYLESIKDRVNPGGFKIPRQPPKYTNVFSQVEDMLEENTYEHDSFCVDNEDTLKWCDNISYLERAEAEIERQRKKKRKATEDLPKKRRRVIQHFSDSD